MQFFCDQCKTKYSIPDEKVAGKILKLRCKKCNNTIVLKDPRSGAPDAEPASSGHRILQDALRRSFGEELSTMDGSLFSSSAEVPEERTQIARIPNFGAAPVPEEWYLADSRGQFGPMDFAELVARIKRGEPDHDAVVWRDGFDDWKGIDRVPELQPYAKHLPPPRRATRELFRETNTFAPGATGGFAPGATGGFAPSPAQPPAAPMQVNAPFAAAPVSASQSFRSPTMDYGAAMPAVSPPAELSATARLAGADRMRTWMVMLGVVVVVAGVAFWLGAKLMEKPAHPPAATPQPVAAVQHPQPQEPMAPSPEEPMREVVYVIASPSNTPPEDAASAGNAGTSGSSGENRTPMGETSGSSRPAGGSSTQPSDSGMAAPAAARSSADFNAVKQRNILEIQRCYEMTVRKGQKELVGQAIQFSIRILPAGQVESVSFKGEMPPMMRACLAGAIQKWQFPAGTKTDTYNFEMHFN